MLMIIEKTRKSATIVAIMRFIFELYIEWPPKNKNRSFYFIPNLPSLQGVPGACSPAAEQGQKAFCHIAQWGLLLHRSNIIGHLGHTIYH